MDSTFSPHIDLDEAYLKAWELSGKLRDGFRSHNWRVEDKFRLAWHQIFLEYLIKEDQALFSTKARLALLVVEEGISLASHPAGRLPNEHDLRKKHIAKCNKFLDELAENLQKHQKQFLQVCHVSKPKPPSP